MKPFKDEKEHNKDIKNISSSTKTTPEIMTFGSENELNKKWQEEWRSPWSWSLQHGYDDTFKLLIDAFNLQGTEIKEIPFLNIINILIQPYSLNILKNWAINDEHCHQLFKFASSAKNDLENNKNEISLIGTASTDSGEKLSTDKYYLIRIFLKSISHEEESHNNWMLTIRLWLLVHAMYRIERGVYLDNNLKRISSYLRKLITNTSFDWDDFLRIRPSPKTNESFSSLNIQFSHLIASLRLEKNSHRFSRFIGAVEIIARNEDEKYDSNFEEHEKHLYKKIVDENFTLKSDETHHNQIIPHYSNHESEFSYLETHVNNNESYSYQKLSAKTWLIAHAEYTHNLPWSWNRLTKLEISELNKWIDIQLSSKNQEFKLLAAFVWIAINIGRSLTRVLDININPKPGKEWTLDPLTHTLKRIPPIRENSWIPKIEDEKNWVKPIACYNEVCIPKNALKILADLIKKHGSNECLAYYWRKTSELSIDAEFNKAMTGSLFRVKSGMLANVLPQQIFEMTNNGNLSQMIAYHPQLSLTGAFAYGSWECSHIKNITNNIHQCLDEQMQPTSEKVLAFGSRAYPVEELLKMAIKKATKIINSVDPMNDPITFHNLYIGYLIVKLWAGTGARPVGDCFESPLHFNLDKGFVFINDKASDDKHNGRLVPLPKEISLTLQLEYKNHLTLLSEALSNSNKELSKEIRCLINNKPTGKLPYFFFINKDDLDWHSIYPTGIDKLMLFDWPLRSNLFRQRLAKVLPEIGVNQEIINAWLGHKTTEIDCYGDYSIRCWIDDLDSEQEKINLAFKRLGFDNIDTWRTSPVIASSKNICFKKKSFGIQYRIEKRKKHYSQIINYTNNEIELFLNNRSIIELKQDEINLLEKQLTTLPNNKYHPNSLLRLSILHDRLDEIWDDESQKINIKKRFIILNDSFTNFSSKTPKLFQVYNEMQSLFTNEYINIIPSRISVISSRLLAVFALLFENRICYSGMLYDIFNYNNFSLVKFKRQFYLEYSEDLEIDNVLKPVQRHRVSSKTAHLLNNLLKSKNKSVNTHPLCKRIIGLLINNTPKTYPDEKEIIHKLCNLIDQTNKIELPGVAAAFLSGRVTSSSLNWYDWVRLRENKILHINSAITHENKLEEIDAVLKSESIKYNSSVVKIIQSNELLINAKKFADEIRDALDRYDKSNIELTINLIKNTIVRYNKKISPSILLVGYWIKNQIQKGKNSKNSPYANSSILNYFSALSSTFVQLAYDKDLLHMDSEEVTSLYNDFLSSTENMKGTYHSDRLISFHHYCSKKGVEDPEWEELNLPIKTRVSSPGIVTTSDYLITLNIIMSSIENKPTLILHMAFLLFLCFRFGLRSMEAIGLRRRDWIEQNGYIYILVSNNSIRELKTNSSRRIVPLLFKPNREETLIIKEILAQYESINHNNDGKSLFSTADSIINNDIEIIRRTLINLLKKITGNPNIVNHHLRHSFSNITSLSLYNLKIESWRNITKGEDNEVEIRQIALGKHHNNALRNSVCAARLLGHAHPRTEAISYQHFYGDWADQLTNVCNKQTDKTLSSAIKIEDIGVLSSPINTIPANIKALKHNAITRTTIMRVLSLVANGKTFTYAADSLLLDPSHIRELEQFVSEISIKQGLIGDGNLTTNRFVEHIHSPAWIRLISFMEKFESKDEPKFAFAINIKNVVEMVGRTRQLTCWHKTQFEFIHLFINFFNLPMSLFEFTNYTNNTDINDNAKKYDFILNLEINRADLDPAFNTETPPGLYTDRMNSIFKKNSNHEIRNSYQLITFLIAFSFHCHLNQAE